MKKAGFKLHVLTLFSVLVAGLLCPETAVATKEIRYRTMIVDVVDGNSVVVSNRVFASGYEIKIGNVVTLDGVVAPKLEERGGQEARDGLSKWILGKHVNVHETLDMGVSRGVVLYATEIPRSFLQEDNVNLKMLEAGLAKWRGGMMTDSVAPEAMMKAQELAQKEGRGIWNPAFTTKTDVLGKSAVPSKKPGAPNPSASLVEAHANPVQATPPQSVCSAPTGRCSFAPTLLVAFCAFLLLIVLALASRRNRR
jgi:endonuclease YncB( thermonuclease family)